MNLTHLADTIREDIALPQLVHEGDTLATYLHRVAEFRKPQSRAAFLLEWWGQWCVWFICIGLPLALSLALWVGR